MRVGEEGNVVLLLAQREQQLLMGARRQRLASLSLSAHAAASPLSSRQPPLAAPPPLPTFRSDSIPLTCKFGPASDGMGHRLCSAHEDGGIRIRDTRSRGQNELQEESPPSSSSSPFSSSSSPSLLQWQAHSNAIFDVSWVQGTSVLLSASGDRTIRVWDLSSAPSTPSLPASSPHLYPLSSPLSSPAPRCLSTLTGHGGSVKSVSSNACNPALLVSGSRDGSIRFWDLRLATGAVSCTEAAHMPPVGAASKSKRQQQQHAVTCVLLLRDGQMVASAGASESTIKLWDVRNTTSPVACLAPTDEPDATCDPLPSSSSAAAASTAAVAPAASLAAKSTATASWSASRRFGRGVSCLSQDVSGTKLVAASTDQRVYLYDLLRVASGPLAAFSGHRAASFYVKAAISHDGRFISCGSSENDLFVWKVSSPRAAPLVLKGHVGELTGVSWCEEDPFKLASCADDCTVRVWDAFIPLLSNFKEKPSPAQTYRGMRRRVYSDPPKEHVTTPNITFHDDGLLKSSSLLGAKASAEERSTIAMKHVPVSSTLPESERRGRGSMDVSRGSQKSVALLERSQEFANVENGASSSQCFLSDKTPNVGPCDENGKSNEIVSSVTRKRQRHLRDFFELS